jgi:hypothetical protein
MKKILGFTGLLAVFTAVMFAQTAAQIYSIGSRGPAGGIIFYDKGEFSDGWRYLEAAPVETEFQAQCGTYGQTVAGTNTETGSGKRNTVIMVEKLKELQESDCAAQLCAGLSYGGFSDWFLPSRDELDLMYKNLKENNLGDFKTENDRANMTNHYLSSSKASNRNTWGQSFSSGYQSTYKTGVYSVRAIRSF